MKTTSKLASTIAPRRRDLKFRLRADRVTNWNPAGVPFTQFMNTLSLFFPDGERFFIESLRNYRDQITDPKLLEDIKQFIGQEAMHTREHLEYNEALEEAGMPAMAYQHRVGVLLKFLQKRMPKHSQLAATIALEHLTALLGDILLKEPALLEGADPDFARVWLWHAMEETEHKGVAYDVWTHVMGANPYSYTVRTGAFVIANVIFWSIVIPYHLSMVQKAGALGDARGWLNAVQYMWGKPGALRRIIPGWLDYFRPGFHPWDHDNRELLAHIEAFAKSAQEAYGKAA